MQRHRGQTWGLALAALGVVYGDIGTSPLYAMRECFHGTHAVGPTPENILGVLSLVFWSLIIIVTVKYLGLVLRADNNGEGGVLALLALIVRTTPGRDGPWIVVMLGLFGASLLYGEGMITPAISVLSAVEGLEIATPVLRPYVVPLTIAILSLVFFVQRRGTGNIGAIFGPVMVLWFASIAALGAVSIAETPEVLAAIDPRAGARFFAHNGWRGFLILGVVVLAITGAEALYADLGHFGRRPIRRAWLAVVLPALMTSYFGQGALLLRAPAAASHPFFLLAPDWALYPLVGLATAATIIASQALISGAFSLSWQAVQLGYLPRLDVRHTSEEEIGQIYIPPVNAALWLATIGLVLGFGSSSGLASAYGAAVTATMLSTTVLLVVHMRRTWGWPLWTVTLCGVFFLSIDLSFFGANLVKIPDGGWFPYVIGGLLMLVMTTWRRGRALLRQRLRERQVSFEDVWARRDPPVRVPGTAIYMTSSTGGMPLALVTLLRHTGVVHERIILLTIQTERVPVVPAEQRLESKPLGHGVHRVLLHYGFVESPNVPRAIRQLPELAGGERISYIIGRETLLPTPRPGMALWRERLFSWLSRMAARPMKFFRIPPDQVLEIGAQIEL